MDLLIKLNQEKGLTFVLVTHDPGVGRQCQRLIRMRDGLIVDDHTDRAGIEAAAASIE
jgi:predicted ABC-type transport system involved in lysophospholipase L1 biosynthesis ATPase subunit